MDVIGTKVPSIELRSLFTGITVEYSYPIKSLIFCSKNPKKLATYVQCTKNFYILCKNRDTSDGSASLLKEKRTATLLSPFARECSDSCRRIRSQRFYSKVVSGEVGPNSKSLH